MSTLTDEALDMWHTRAFTAPSFKALAVPPSHMLALVEEVRELRATVSKSSARLADDDRALMGAARIAAEADHLRDLMARLMEALRAPIGWPTTEAAMLEHARRAGAVLEAVGVLGENIADHDQMLTAWLSDDLPMMCAFTRRSDGRQVETCEEMLADALIALAKEVQQ